MKTTSTALQNALAAALSQKDTTLVYADCFTFTLAVGTVLTYTNADVPVVYNGRKFRADGPLVQGLNYKSSVGASVDRQSITLSARPYDVALGSSILATLAGGMFDGCLVRRDRVFFSDVIGGTVIDGVCMFQGRVSVIDSIGRTTAKISVASDMVLLDVDMPRNIYQPTCLNTLFDSNCGLQANAFGTPGSVTAGSSSTTINFSGAQAVHLQGSVLFSTGPNVGLRATVRAVNPGVSFTLIYPLPFAPVVGDTFTVFQGCDHTSPTCAAKFNNLARFRGFPFVPPPQMAV